MAGSLGRFLCPSAAGLSSRDDVPAGVNGGDCMAEAVVPTEARCPECPDVVREAGEGDGALSVSAVCPKSHMFNAQLTRDGGSETGSKEKFSMRLAWQRDA